MTNIVGSANIKIDAVDSEFKRKLKSAERQTRTSAGSMEKDLKRVDRQSRSLTKSLGGIKGALIGIVGGVALRGIINVNKEFETLNLTLNTVFGSVEKGKAAMGFIEEFALKTPFTIQQLSKAMITLQATGIEPTEKLLTTLGDAAAVTTDKVAAFEALVRVTSRSVASIGLEELNQIAEKGLPVWDILQKRLGVSRLELSKVGKTAEGAKEIMDALKDGLNERFGGGMARSATTLDTSLSNMAISGTQLIKALGDGGLTKTLTSFAGSVKKLFDEMKPFATFIGSVLSVAVDGLATAVSKIADAVGGVTKSIKDLKDRIKDVNAGGDGTSTSSSGFDGPTRLTIAAEQDASLQRTASRAADARDAWYEEHNKTPTIGPEAHMRSIITKDPHDRWQEWQSTKTFLNNRGRMSDNQRARELESSGRYQSSPDYLRSGFDSDPAERFARAGRTAGISAAIGEEDTARNDRNLAGDVMSFKSRGNNMDAILSARMAEEHENNQKRIKEANDRMRKSFEDLGESISDTFAEALVEGKLSMDTLVDVGKSFVKRLVSQFIELMVFEPLIKSLFGGVSAGASSGASTGVAGLSANQHGGRVSPGIPLLVGDGGRAEVFRPGSSGTILPNAERAMGSMGGSSIHVENHFTISADVGDAQQVNIQNAIDQAVDRSITTIQDEVGRGGSATLAFQGL